MTGVKFVFNDLREFSRDLQAIDDGRFDRGLRPVLKSFADDAALRVRIAYGVFYQRRDGHGQASIRSLASIDRASVAIGGVKAPYMIGQEFGSDRLKRFAPRTPSYEGGSEGRFLYPTLRAALPDLADELWDAIDGFVGPVFSGGGVTRTRQTLDVGLPL